MAVRDTIRYGDVDYSNPEVMITERYINRRSTIVATLSDSQLTSVDLQKMMEAGMNVARFKMSSHTRGDRVKLLGKLDKAAAVCCKKYGIPDWPVATSVELKTCIVKTGILEGESFAVKITENSEVILTCNLSDYNKCSPRKIFVDNSHLTIDITVGREISIGGDNIVLDCTEIVNEKAIKCIVRKGGNLYNMSNVCVRGITQSRPYLTKRDLQIIKFALEYQVDVITIYYVRSVETIRMAKQYIKKEGKNIKSPLILSGISTEQGLREIDDILHESDGIILSREYLPFEVEAAKKYRLNNVQKWLSAKCQQAGKPLYLIGGIFHEALHTGEFNDYEIQDVSHAILDGITGFILRDCPDIEITVECIKALDQVCRTVEPYTALKTHFWSLTDQMRIPLNAAEACVISCAALANQTKAQVIILPTVTGRTAKALFSMRPTCVVIAICTSPRVTRMLQLYRCMLPLLYAGVPHNKFHLTVQERIDYAVEYSVKRNWLFYGDNYVILQRGTERSSFCDTVRVFKVIISKKPLVECNTEDGEPDNLLML